MRYLHGFHDQGGADLHGSHPGWTYVTEEVGTNIQAQGKDYRDISSKGIGVIVRLNHGYGKKGTIPLPADYLHFAKACASFVATSQGVSYWVIGNEPNHEAERPNGIVITAFDYLRCYLICWHKIRETSPQAKIGPAAIAPYHASPTPWNEYLKAVLKGLVEFQGDGTPLLDLLSIHAYARGTNPAAITSDLYMGPPLTGLNASFRTYRDALACVPASLAHLPAFISEFDVLEAWPNQNTGIISAMYQEVNKWNQKQGVQKIIGAVCFRWLVGINTVDWGMANKPNLLEDFKTAASMGFVSPEIAQGGGEPLGNTVLLPSIIGIGGGLSMSPISRKIDQRLLDRGTKIIDAQEPVGSTVWRLIEAKFFPVGTGAEESGGRHHAYVEALDEEGKPLSGIQFEYHWDSGHAAIVTNGKSGFDAGNQPFSEGKNAFTVSIAHGDTVEGIGMGQDDPGGWNAGEHTSTLLRYQRQKVGEPSIPVSPSLPPPRPKTMIQIVHPVVDPSKRAITEAFGDDPAYYSHFSLDGVPFKGHEGIDFACPPRSVIQAVDDGIASEVGDQEDVGYGKYIKLVHSWGESIYGHLEEQWLNVGEKVSKSQQVGLTGYTGNVLPKGPGGAHLHFGMRINPYDRRDGWGGFSDPAPYLPGGSSTPIPVPVSSPGINELVEMAKGAASNSGIDWRLFVSLIHAESSFNPQAINPSSGASGLGQITKPTWNEWSTKLGATNILLPFDNLRVAAAYLQWCIAQENGSVRRGLWAYNWGVGNVAAGGEPPQETVEYASKVIHGQELLNLIVPANGDLTGAR